MKNLLLYTISILSLPANGFAANLYDWGNDFTVSGNHNAYSSTFSKFADEDGYNTSTSNTKFIYYDIDINNNITTNYYDYSMSTNKSTVFGSGSLSYYGLWNISDGNPPFLSSGSSSNYDIRALYNTSTNKTLTGGTGGTNIANSFVNLNKNDFFDTTTPASFYNGTAINNTDSSAIGNIDGDFVNNVLNSIRQFAFYSYGAAIYNNNNSEIGDINGSFIGNKLDTLNGAGTAIANLNGSEIGTITGDFIRNTAKTNTFLSGAIILNRNSTINAIIGDFINNFGVSNASIDGIIGNDSNAAINNITGDFIGNTVLTKSNSRSATASILDNSATITNITGNFINNNISASTTLLQSGIISNNGSGEISNITGNFIGNLIETEAGSIAAAIYNGSSASLTISATGQDIAFSGNTINEEGSISYNAIYNEGGTVNLKSDNSHKIELFDALLGDGEYHLSGNLSLLGEHANISDTSNLNILGGGISTIDNNIRTTTIGNVTLSDNSYYKLDVDLSLSTSDNLDAESIQANGNKILINEINIMNDPANVIPVNVLVASGALYGGDYFDIAQGASLNIIKPAGSIEDYNNGYLISFIDDIGSLNFSFSTLSYAITSSVSDKAYAMASDAVIENVQLNGEDLTVDGNGFNIGTGTIDINNKTLSLTDVNLLSNINVNNGTLNLYEGAIINASILNTGTLNINESILINSDMTGFNGYANLTGGVLSLGENAEFFDDTFNVTNNPTLNLQNKSIKSYDAASWNLGSDLNILIDVDLAKKEADSIINYSGTTNNINIDGINLLSEVEGSTKVSVTNNQGGGNFTISSKNLEIKEPIYTYDYVIDDKELSSLGFLTFNSKPKTISTEIKETNITQNSLQLSLATIYKELFANFGIEDLIKIRGLSSGDQKNYFSNVWMQSFGKKEDLSFEHAPTFDSLLYGLVVGADTNKVHYSNNIEGLYSLYAGYIGSSQEHEDITIEQNAITLGARALFTDNNLFSGITSSLTVSDVESNDIFGKNSYNIYSFGISSKTGYNFNSINKKYRIQPSIMLSYIYGYTPDFENISGIQITDAATHLLQIKPGIKLIYYANKALQTYTELNYNWNINFGSQTMADDIILPQVSVEPYTEFTIGMQKNITNTSSGYLEVSASSGGRKGFGGKIGFQWDL